VKRIDLRLSDDLHARCKALAEADNRSLNSWIVQSLIKESSPFNVKYPPVQMSAMTRDADPVGYAAMPGRQSDAEVTPLFKQTKKGRR